MSLPPNQRTSTAAGGKALATDATLQPAAARAGWVRRHRIGLNTGFCLAFFLLLCVPMLAQLLQFEPATPAAEGRVLAPRPRVPRSLAELEQFSGQVEAFVNDHFGLRPLLVALNNIARYKILGEMGTSQVVVGTQGRLFLGNHANGAEFSLIQTVCGSGVTQAAIARTRGELVDLLNRLRSAPPTLLVIVPSAPALYPENLPPWLAHQCAQAKLPAQSVVESLPPSLSDQVYYPLELMRALKAQMEVIPRKNFHWQGAAPHRVAEDIAERRLGLTRMLRIPEVPDEATSDLSQLNPGPWIHNSVMDPDFQRAGIDYCHGPRCLPGLAAAAERISVMARWRRVDHSDAPRRLLILSDSFGNAISGYFTEYFTEVTQLNITALERLPQERRELVRRWMRELAPDQILLVFHDGGLFQIAPFVRTAWPY